MRVWLGLFVLFATSPLPETEKQPSSRDGTRAMVERLDELAKRSANKDNPYANRARAEYWGARERFAGSLSEGLRFKLEKARELLNQGASEEAIEELRYLKSFFEIRAGSVDPKAYRFIRRLLAISYLRLGEQENCADHHTASSCILPIRGDGVHRIKRGSRGAIEQYTSMLKDYPEDLEFRWLLNVAAMTLGEYPDGVPDVFRIPPEAFASEDEIAHFTDVAPGAGVAATGLSGGVAVDDFDGDGFLDIIASSWGLRDPVRFFRSRGDGTFEDRSSAAGLDGIVSGLNLRHADFDNDGDLDVLVLRGAWLGAFGNHPNSLLENQGDGRFLDVTEAAGLFSLHPTQTAAWGDFDNDGFLDLFVGNETTRGSVHRSELYRNLGNGTFREMSGDVGIHVEAYVKGVAWGDIDGDSDLDLYLSVLEGDNLLFENRLSGTDEDGRFHEIAARAGVQKPHDSFPVWFFDFDNDGALDLFACGYDLGRYSSFAKDVAAHYLGLESPAETPRLYHNDGAGTFTDVTASMGLDEPLFAMGSNFGDLDNDGFLDFYLGTGEPELTSLIPNRMFHNAGGKAFRDVTTAGGFGHLQKGHAVGFGDFDNDGDQDLYTVLGGAYEGDTFPNSLFENPGTPPGLGRFLNLRLEGRRSNRDGIGARIRVDVHAGDVQRSIFRTVGSGSSFGGSTLRQEIGLGDATAIDRLAVFWPASGITDRYEDVPLDRFYKVIEGKSLEPIEVRTFDFPH